MIKLTVLYGHPTDPEAFEEYYADVHMPLVEKIPGAERWEAARVVDKWKATRRPTTASLSSGSRTRTRCRRQWDRPRDRRR
jgi:uncharacterized protein (TIGR02118 family)